MTGAPTMFWHGDRAESERLDHDLEVDVAVVGGGMAGMSTAWELANSGHSVALLEGARVGHGVTGHGSGSLSVLQGRRFSELEATLGTRVATRYAESQLLAVQHLTGIVKRLGDRCGLERQPAFLLAEKESGLDPLAAELTAARRVGLNVNLSLTARLPFPAAGTARLDNQVAVNPVAYLDALARSLVAAGGQVYEGTRVTALETDRVPVLVTADGCRVRARDVVVAARSPMFDHSLLTPHLRHRREVMIAGRSCTASRWPPGLYAGVGDSSWSFRITHPTGHEASVLVTSDLPASAGPDQPQPFDQLMGWADSRFDAPDWSSVWLGSDVESSDGLPVVGPLHPGRRDVWVATGFGGCGLADGVLAGVILRDLVEGRETSYTSLFHPRRLAPVNGTVSSTT